MDKIELVKELRSGNTSNLEEIKKQISQNLVEINNEFISTFSDPSSKVTRNFWRKKAKPFIESDLPLLGWKNFSQFKQSILGKEEQKVRREDIDIVKQFSSKNKTYFVTSVIIGEKIDIEFFNSIKSFAKHRKAEIVILPMKSLYRDEQWSNEEYDLLSPYIATEYIFNSNLMAYDFMLNSQMTNPLTGLGRYGQKEFSLIVASPKQQMVSVPVSPSRMPHILLSTGSMSNPEYRKSRVGRFSEQDHIIGGVVVETKGDLYHVRHVQCNKDKSFRDLNTIYESDSWKNVEDSEAIVLGDWHNGLTDPTARKSSFEQIKFYNPKQVFLHDFVDSYSISHHTQYDIKTKVRRNESKFATLENELNMAVEELEVFVKQFPNVKFKIVASNHSPDHIVKYLSDGRWIEDTVNTKFSIDLFKDVIEGKDPVEEYVFRKNPILKNNIEFLKRDKDVYVEGILCSSHGDKASGSSRGSTPIGKELSFGSSITGHSHTVSILRNAWTVGTNSYLTLDYTVGNPTSWIHANCVVFKEGKRQMLISIKGKWKN